MPTLLDQLLLSDHLQGGHFPFIRRATPQPFTGDTQTHNVQIGEVEEGELVLIYWANDGNAVAAPDDATYEELFNATSGTAARHAIFGKVADGTTSGDVVNIGTSANEKAVAMVVVIGGWFGGTLADGVSVGASATGTSSAPNSASHTAPGAWGTDDFLWISSYGADDDDDLTTPPTNYLVTRPGEVGSAGSFYVQSDESTSSCSMALAYRKHEVTTEDPGAFAIAASEEWAAVTVVIRPAFSGSIVQASLLQSLATVFNPTVQQVVQPPLLVDAVSVFGPTVVQQVAPPLLDAQAQVFSPSVVQVVAVSLLSNPPTLFDPAVSQTSSSPSPDLLVNPTTVFTPTVIPTQFVGPELLSNPATVFSPGISQVVQPPILLNSSEVFSPSIVLLVFVPLLVDPVTVFSPATIQHVSVPLLVDPVTVFSPNVAWLLGPGLISNPATVFDPEIKQVTLGRAASVVRGINKGAADPVKPADAAARPGRIGHAQSDRRLKG